jgi:hypothetical protein
VKVHVNLDKKTMSQLHDIHTAISDLHFGTEKKSGLTRSRIISEAISFWHGFCRNGQESKEKQVAMSKEASDINDHICDLILDKYGIWGVWALAVHSATVLPAMRDWLEHEARKSRRAQLSVVR